MARVLYLIISHVNPEQVLRLVKAIKNGSTEAIIVVHYDFQNSKHDLDPTDFEKLSDVHVLREYVAVQWGRFSLVQAILHCIHWILENSLEFDWLVLLSGQDYPIQPIAQIEQFLHNTQFDGFMEYFRADCPPEEPQEFGLRWAKDTGIVRLFYQYYLLPFQLPSYVKAALFHLDRLTKWQSLIRFIVDRNGVSVGLKCFSKPFNQNFYCYAGSTWFTLSKSCICYIDDFTQQNLKFLSYYSNKIVSDESFFQTILLNQPGFNILNDNKRYISWHSAHPSSPSILTSQHFASLVRSNKHFARKFDPNQDSQVLDLIDREVLA